ncbi:MAG: hypothetical protein ACK52S_08355 [Pirellula sp.]
MNPTAEFNGEIQWRTPTARTIDVPDRRVLVDCSGCVMQGMEFGRYRHEVPWVPTLKYLRLSR